MVSMACQDINKLRGWRNLADDAGTWLRYNELHNSEVHVMLFSKPVTELIQTRVSTRTFDGRAPEPAALQILADEIAAINASGVCACRWLLVGIGADVAGQVLKLGTYGVISGARAYLIGLINADSPDALNFGRLFEQLVLRATDLGLQTCWLGGIFRKSDLLRSLQLEPNEHIAAISPLGYRQARPRLLETAMRAAVGADQRKPWSALFFNGDVSVPLSKGAAGKAATPLEMVRLGPSASNKQPWRVIMADGQLHFYLCRTPGYAGRLVSAFDLQLNDLGIAICHFELAAAEIGLPGYWEKRTGTHGPSDWEYVQSWVL
jgi:hypothetical protein